MENNKWNEEEILFLKEYFPKYGFKYVSQHLTNKTKNSIKNKIYTLGLKNDGTPIHYLEENLKKIVSESLSYSEVLRRLNIKTNSGNFSTLKRYIKKYNIEIKNFTPYSNNNKNRNYMLNFVNNKISIEKILVENSTYTNNVNLKNRLYKEGLKARCCELCGQTEEWQGKRMSLILDHKNGVHGDNRLENLQIVCPNCNATLDTHCRGSKGLIKKEPKSKIEYLERRKCERPPYELLVQEIKELGYCAIGRKYGVSDNSIRKWKLDYEKN